MCVDPNPKFSSNPMMAPAATKRRTLTTDELMRIQEQPPLKRARLADVHSFSDESDAEICLGAGESKSDLNEDEDNVDKDEDEGKDEGEDEEVGKRHGDQDEEMQAVKDARSGIFDFELSRVRITPTRPAPLRHSAPALSFAALGISPHLLTALSCMSIKTPTEVQAACIPPLLAGR
jgi:ATP-dependent RNA helicase DDX49/DBP8